MKLNSIYVKKLFASKAQKDWENNKEKIKGEKEKQQ